MRSLAPVYTSIFCLFLMHAALAESHHPAAFLDTISGRKDEGAQIYAHFCANCHAQKPLIPLGAPRIGIKEDWSVRLKQQISILFKHVDEGIGSMPARGGCFECSDDQLILAIVEMLPNGEKKSAYNSLKDHKKSTK